ncbi:MAG: (Fe-S)-binding protein [Nitrososphaeria archaeon]
MSLEDNLADEIMEKVQRCIRCGFCIYVCPSWRMHGYMEYYGPRARISLVRELLNEGRAYSTYVDSLYSCMACRRCEIECPTGIEIGEVVVQARRLLRKTALQHDRPAEFGRVPKYLEPPHPHNRLASLIKQCHNPYGEPHENRFAWLKTRRG